MILQVGKAKVGGSVASELRPEQLKELTIPDRYVLSGALVKAYGNELIR